MAPQKDPHIEIRGTGGARQLLTHVEKNWLKCGRKMSTGQHSALYFMVTLLWEARRAGMVTGPSDGKSGAAQSRGLTQVDYREDNVAVRQDGVIELKPKTCRWDWSSQCVNIKLAKGTNLCGQRHHKVTASAPKARMSNSATVKPSHANPAVVPS